MSQLAYNINNQIDFENVFTPYLVADNTKSSDAKNINSVYVLGAVLILLQILDGVLTAAGISSLGVEGEGNLLLKSLMETIGYIPALAISKLVVIAIIAAISSCAKQISWIRYAFSGLVAVYVVFAIVPWILILSGVLC